MTNSSGIGRFVWYELMTPDPKAAIAFYKSQVAPLERDHVLSERLAANVPEQYWRLAAPPAGWELLIDLV